MGQGGDLINLHINCPNIRDMPNNQIPLQKVGDYWGFDTRSVTVQYTETVAVLKVSSEVIKCPTIGAASFGQNPYVARLLPVRGVVGHNIDRCIRNKNYTHLQLRKSLIHASFSLQIRAANLSGECFFWKETFARLKFGWRAHHQVRSQTHTSQLHLECGMMNSVSLCRHVCVNEPVSLFCVSKTLPSQKPGRLWIVCLTLASEIQIPLNVCPLSVII